MTWDCVSSDFRENCGWWNCTRCLWNQQHCLQGAKLFILLLMCLIHPSHIETCTKICHMDTTLVYLSVLALGYLTTSVKFTSNFQLLKVHTYIYIHVLNSAGWGILLGSAVFRGNPNGFLRKKKRSRRKKNSQKKTKALGEKITYYIHGLNTQVLIHVLWFTVQKELNFVPGEAWHPQEMSIINFGW